QILRLVADNASNNNTMLDGLEFELPGFQGSLTCVRYIGHILNLCVKVCLCTLHIQIFLTGCVGHPVPVHSQEVGSTCICLCGRGTLLPMS
ncbi:hypothetical protein K439DRAFT_1346283, partial [Ramaria rubella]